MIITKSIKNQIKRIHSSLIGKTTLAKKYLLPDEDHSQVCEILNDLLLKEYLQRDVYEHYQHTLFGPSGIAVKEHLNEHLEQEMLHAEILQRYIIGYGGELPTQRISVPKVDNNLKSILTLDLALEIEAVDNYITALKSIEGKDEYTPLRVELENILIQEQEHVHDITRWLT